MRGNKKPSLGDGSISNNSGIDYSTPLRYDWQKVLNHLLNIGSALSIEIEREYSIRYAPSTIQAIEGRGISINSISEPYRRKDGKISQLARYSIAEGWEDRAKSLLGEGL